MNSEDRMTDLLFIQNSIEGFHKQLQYMNTEGMDVEEIFLLITIRTFCRAITNICERAQDDWMEKE